MYRVGICGHFAIGKELLNGQTVKTKILNDELEQKIGKKNIQIVDTHNWSNSPLRLIKKCFSLVKKSKNIIILPAHNGVKIFIPMFLSLNIFFKRKLHYIVIGGWLPEFLQNNKWLIKWMKKLDGIYVETSSMKKKLENIGIENVIYMPNFKKLKVIQEEDLVYQHTKPYKVCTFSRVMKEKGIEDAIKAVERVNDIIGEDVYKLDIYGQIESDYEDQFYNILKNSSHSIEYKGSIPFDKSVETLKKYFILCFPTYYKGEGFAGTILDSFSAGVPVVATNWAYNSEIINQGKDGFIYDVNSKEELDSILIRLYENTELALSMKKNCLERIQEYLPNKVINEFIEYLA